MSKSHRPHPQTRARTRDAIQILEELKRLLIIAESDPLCRQAQELYDNVERTLREAHRLWRENEHKRTLREDETRV
jgi:hypothetical protein